MSNELGTWIKHARDLNEFTLTQLSEKSGISIAQLSRIETGKRGAPKPDTLKKLSIALNLPFNELMIMAGHLNKDDDAQLNRIDQFNSNYDLDEKIKRVVAMLTDEKGFFFSYLQEAVIEIFKDKQINDESTAFFKLYESGVEEFKEEPLTLNEITEDTFNLVCNYEVLSEVILEKLSYEEKEILLKELTSIAIKHELNKEDDNEIKDLEEFLNQPEISFNGKPISQELKQRILGYAEALTDQDK